MIKGKSVEEIAVFGIQPESAAKILSFVGFINMCKEGKEFEQILKEVFVKNIRRNQPDAFREEKYSYEEHLVD